MVQYVTKKNEVQASRSKCVVVVYETSAIREHAVRFCERLAQENASTALSEMNWWSFHLLSDPVSANDAVQKAAGADVIVFAMKAGGDLPDEIKLWIEKWLNKRGEREGALFGLLAREEGPYEVAAFREIYLRNIALRAGMDYLSHAAPTASRAMPDSLDSFNRRAGQVTSVLNNILHAHPHTTAPRL